MWYLIVFAYKRNRIANIKCFINIEKFPPTLSEIRRIENKLEKTIKCKRVVIINFFPLADE